MAQRRAPAKHRAPSTAPGDDFDFLASQQSTGSDDHAIQLAIAQQVMASKEKKRKEHEKRFLQVAKNKLNAERIAAVEEFKNTVDVTGKVYEKFIFDYAAVDDHIRALWMEIKKEEQTLIDIAKKRRVKNRAQYLTTEKAQIGGMGQVREACRDARLTIGTLAPAAV
ncbi:hypothetical protein C8R45DRAFT_1026771 [Mycena sanguinolenta]|nr:hypothetical protein C8R45DRAFT_1026771 [Mycena sanguinolenta]